MRTLELLVDEVRIEAGATPKWVHDPDESKVAKFLEAFPAVKPARSRQEIYDDPELQQQLAAFYQDIETHFEGDRIVHVSAEGSVDEVHAEIVRQVRILRGEEQP